MEPNQVKQQAVLACGEVHLQLQSHPLRQAGDGEPKYVDASCQQRITKSGTPWSKQAEASHAKWHHKGGLFSAYQIRLSIWLLFMFNVSRALMSSTKEVKSLLKEEQHTCLLMTWKPSLYFLRFIHRFFLNLSKIVPTNGFFFSLQFPFLTLTSKAIVFVQCHSFTTHLKSALQKAIIWNEEAQIKDWNKN